MASTSIVLAFDTTAVRIALEALEALRDRQSAAGWSLIARLFDIPAFCDGLVEAAWIHTTLVAVPSERLLRLINEARKGDVDLAVIDRALGPDMRGLLETSISASVASPAEEGPVL